MIKTYTDLSVAEYNSLEELAAHRSEAAGADIISVLHRVPGGIYHSRSMLWQGVIYEGETPEQFIRSKRERKSLKETKKYFADQGYTIQITEMDLSQYEHFKEIYYKKLTEKERPLSIDIESLIKGRILVGRTVYLIGLYKDESLESGLAFSITDDEVRVSVGAKKRFDAVRGGIGGLLEIELLNFCIENGIQKISHGRGYNPAGIVTTSGLFEFKARYGFSAFPYKYWLTTFIASPEKLLSDLIFVTANSDGPAYVVVSDKPEKNIRARFKTTEVSNISILSYAEVAEQYANFSEQYLQPTDPA